jgi:hypothetical protein
VKVLLVVGLVVLAVLVAELVRRRRSDPPTQGASPHHVPTQIDRGDFEGDDAEWLVAVFTSATCGTCAETLARAGILNSDAVAVAEVEVTAHPELHRRYGIDAVPIVVIVDRRGVVRKSFVGPVSATHLWGAVAELREPGSVPPGCGQH